MVRKIQALTTPLSTKHEVSVFKKSENPFEKRDFLRSLFNLLLHFNYAVVEHGYLHAVLDVCEKVITKRIYDGHLH